MKKILVPYDFSGHAENALDFAYQIAKKSEGEITILHVIEHPSEDSFNTYGIIAEPDQSEKIYMIELIKKTLEKINQLAASEHFSGVKMQSKVVLGNPYENISKEVLEMSADLIVMGTKGASGLQELFVGSNAEKVVRFAKCPVITVPTKVDFTKINNIGFAINFEEEQEQVIELLKTYQNVFKAKLNLVWVDTLHVIENSDLINERLENFAKKYNIENYNTYAYKALTPEQGILNFALQENMDLIAMATHGFKGLAHLFLGSIAEDVVNHSKIPVWTLSLKEIN